MHIEPTSSSFPPFSVAHGQCSSCKSTYGGSATTFHADVKRDGHYTCIREWLTTKCFMGDGVVFRRDGIPLNSSTVHGSY